MTGVADSVDVHIVLYNSPKCVIRCIESVLEQDGFRVGENLRITVTENGSKISLADILRDRFGASVNFVINKSNLGFAGAHNQGAFRYLKSNFKYYLILNPDLRLERNAVKIGRAHV